MMNTTLTDAPVETPTEAPTPIKPDTAPARQDPPTPITDPREAPRPKRETIPNRCPCQEVDGDAFAGVDFSNLRNQNLSV